MLQCRISKVSWNNIFLIIWVLSSKQAFSTSLHTHPITKFLLYFVEQEKSLTFPGKLPVIFIEVLRIFQFQWKRVAGYNTPSLAIHINSFCWEDCPESGSGNPELIMLLSSLSVMFGIDALSSKLNYCFSVSAATTLQWQCVSRH